MREGAATSRSTLSRKEEEAESEKRAKKAKSQANRQANAGRGSPRYPLSHELFDSSRKQDAKTLWESRPGPLHLLVALVPEAVLVVQSRGGTDRPPRRAYHASREEDRLKVTAVGVEAVNQSVRRSGVEEPIVPFAVGFERPAECVYGEETRRGVLLCAFT